jgi:hypothetical protein
VSIAERGGESLRPHVDEVHARTSRGGELVEQGDGREHSPSVTAWADGAGVGFVAMSEPTQDAVAATGRCMVAREGELRRLNELALLAGVPAAAEGLFALGDVNYLGVLGVPTVDGEDMLVMWFAGVGQPVGTVDIEPGELPLFRLTQRQVEAGPKAIIMHSQSHLVGMVRAARFEPVALRAWITERAKQLIVEVGGKVQTEADDGE